MNMPDFLSSLDVFDRGGSQLFLGESPNGTYAVYCRDAQRFRAGSNVAVLYVLEGTEFQRAESEKTELQSFLKVPRNLGEKLVERFILQRCRHGSSHCLKCKMFFELNVHLLCDHCRFRVCSNCGACWCKRAQNGIVPWPVW